MGDITIVALRAILPELYLAAMAMFLLMAAVSKCRNTCNAMLNGTLFTLLGTGYFLWPQLFNPPLTVFNGMFAVNAYVAFSGLIILAVSALSVMIAAGWLKEGARPSEFLVLMLISALGMVLMVAANDLLALYLALELSSLSLYVLAAFERDHAKSSEAGLKYFVLGALASGMLLLGMSLVYGFAGTTGFSPLAELFLKGAASKGVIVGLVLIIIGFCFKMSAAPFHMWTPDVYEGAPTPVTAFFSAAPKIAAAFLFARFLLLPFGPMIGQWQQVIVFVSVLSMVVGALAAIMQTNIKRLLAYSSIGHAGWLLMGIAAGTTDGAQAVLIYAALYAFTGLGAFGCVLMMRRSGHYIEDIRELAGLSRRRPALAFVFASFMFSLAGIPPLAGFFGKLYAVLAAVHAGLVWLAIIGLLTSVIGAFYYLKIVKIMYLDEPADSFDAPDSLWLQTGIAIAAAVTLLFFVMPTPLVAEAKIAAEALLH